MADRRMLWKNVCRSRKVNSLSDRAALLWTWAIPWFDRDGFLEADPDYIREVIFPKKPISEQEALGLLLELFESGLWIPFNLDGKIIAFDPKFKKFQKIQYDRESKSEFKDSCSKITLEQLLEHSMSTLPEVKLSKVKLSKESKETEKTKDALHFKTEDQKKELQNLRVKVNSMFPNFRLNLFLQNHNRAHPEALLHTLRKLIEYPEKIGEVENPMALCESIIKIENQNYNAADFYTGELKNKVDFSSIAEGLKQLNKKTEKEL